MNSLMLIRIICLNQIAILYIKLQNGGHYESEAGEIQ